MHVQKTLHVDMCDITALGRVSIAGRSFGNRYCLRRRAPLPVLITAVLLNQQAAFATTPTGCYFNDDEFSDLAIGAPFEDVGSVSAAGAVNVIYGRFGFGLGTEGNQLWSQNTSLSFPIKGVSEEFDIFGDTLACGDFNGDGLDDLAIGSPFEDVDGINGAGAVNVIYGNPGFGLGTEDNQIWTPSSGLVNSIAAREFGISLATGDFDGNEVDDLVVARYDNSGGAVHVLYGQLGSGLTTEGNQMWSQDTVSTEAIQGESEPGDGFGTSPVAGDFNGDGYDDLAIGVPNETLGGIEAAGVVNVIYGRESFGLGTEGNQLWSQDTELTLPILGVAEEGDRFGAMLVSGNFDGDDYDDLAVGVPGEDVNGVDSAGAVNVIYGHEDFGLGTEGNQLWSQDTELSEPIAGAIEEDDRFGDSLAAGDFDGDGYDDLAVGSWSEDVGIVDDAGAVNIIYGYPGFGLGTVDNQLWSQDTELTLPIAGVAEDGDEFGRSLSAGDFDGDGYDDLAVGSWSEDVGIVDDAGAVNIIYGYPGFGLGTSENQIWTQDTSLSFPVEGVAEPGDAFGLSLSGNGSHSWWQ